MKTSPFGKKLTASEHKGVRFAKYCLYGRHLQVAQKVRSFNKAASKIIFKTVKFIITRVHNTQEKCCYSEYPLQAIKHPER
jgi:hypothetical protein